MKRKTPRQELEELNIKNGNDGFYGLHNQFAQMIRSRLDEQTNKLLNSSIFYGVLPGQMEYNNIYNMLLDGKSIKAIKKYYGK